MGSIDKPREYENHRESILPCLEHKRVSMMSLDVGLRAFYVESMEIPSLDHFLPQISFSELVSELSASPSLSICV
jgi:hypothetical protein